MKRYTIKDFQRDFSDDKACLEWLKNNRWPSGIMCPKCECVTPHHMMEKRRAYACQHCGTHVYPCAGTIFHKSPTPLTSWFHAAFLMASTRCGISAKQVERELGVTYKTAWRMCHLIRQSLKEGNSPLGGGSGQVEVDGSYFGGEAKNMHKHKREAKIQGRGTVGKTAVFGMVERQGCVLAKVVPNVLMSTLTQEILSSVQAGTVINSDEFRSYNALKVNGYIHDVVVHSVSEYVKGMCHTNTIEGYWSLVKRGIDGVYHQVSPKYLQNYLNEYSFRYNHRNDEKPMFRSFLDQMKADVKPLAPKAAQKRDD